MKKYSKILILFLGILLSSIAPISILAADFDYQIDVKQKWHQEDTFIPGELDNYTLSNNKKIRLLVGIKSGSDFFAETKIADQDLIDKWVAQAKSNDSLSGWLSRKVMDSHVLRSSPSKTRVVIRSVVTKEQHSSASESGTSSTEYWIESKVYEITTDGLAFAVLVYPQSIEKPLQSSLESDLQTFTTVTDPKQARRIGDSHAEKIANFIYDIKSKQIGRIISPLLSRMPTSTQAWAEDATCESEKEKYLLEGEWTEKPGSAIFRFETMIRDMKSLAASIDLKDGKTPKQKEKLQCLVKLTESAYSNSTSYWANRLSSDGCTLDEQKPDERPEECPDSTWDEFDSSTELLGAVLLELNEAKELTTKFQGEGVKAPSPADQERLEAQGACANCKASTIAKLLVEAKKKEDPEYGNTEYCCSGVGVAGATKGPLAQILEAEIADFSKWDSAEQVRECFDRSQPTKKNSGISDCLLKAVNGFKDGIVATVKTLWKTLTSIFQTETYVAIWNFVSNLPDSLFKIAEQIQKAVATQINGWSTCLNNYEAAQYTCRKTGQILGVLATPAGLTKLAGFLKASQSGQAVAKFAVEALGKVPGGQKAMSITKNVATKLKTTLAAKQKTARVGRAIMVEETKARSAQVLKVALSKSKELFEKTVRQSVRDKMSRAAKFAATPVVNSARRLSSKFGLNIKSEIPGNSVLGRRALKQRETVSRRFEPTKKELVSREEIGYQKTLRSSHGTKEEIQAELAKKRLELERLDRTIAEMGKTAHPLLGDVGMALQRSEMVGNRAVLQGELKALEAIERPGRWSGIPKFNPKKYQKSKEVVARSDAGELPKIWAEKKTILKSEVLDDLVSTRNAVQAARTSAMTEMARLGGLKNLFKRRALKKQIERSVAFEAELTKRIESISLKGSGGDPNAAKKMVLTIEEIRKQQEFMRPHTEWQQQVR